MFAGSKSCKKKKGSVLISKGHEHDRSPQNAHVTMNPCGEERRSMTWQGDHLQNPGGIRGSGRQRVSCCVEE